MSMKLNISILGEKDIGKTTLINDYINVNNFQKKEKAGHISFSKSFRDGNSMKLYLYEFSNIPTNKKDLVSNQCIIIMFDMTSRSSFEQVLNEWIKFLKEIKYNNSIILFGTKKFNEEGNRLPKTDEQEITELIEIAKIKGKFYDIMNKNQKEKTDLIDSLIETSYEEAKNNMNKKDCIIF